MYLGVGAKISKSFSVFTVKISRQQLYIFPEMQCFELVSGNPLQNVCINFLCPNVSRHNQCYLRKIFAKDQNDLIKRRLFNVFDIADSAGCAEKQYLCCVKKSS